METCKRTGCSGQIVDGVCEDCGRAPAGKSLIAEALNPVNTAGLAKVASGRSSMTGSAISGRTGSTRSGRLSSRSGRSSSRRSLGGGIVNLPPLPSMDPMQAIMAQAVVPDNKRYCNSCQSKVSHQQGFCPMCGQEYSFIPTLKAGDIVAEQYEVKGAIAYGGLGWVYLGWDLTLSRWVVLKGLLNSKDEISAAAALAERQFLAAVKHPKIVGVYNFVNRGSEGYIVMEYVGGKTLKQIRQERGPLPVAEAIAYIHGILPAFSYLARKDLVYCDFKLDNCMIEEDDVKLIDMGGVRRIDDLDSDIYGTKGYSAPEANESPSFVSDLYTVGRTLAVLIMDFKFQSTYEYKLPTPQEQPLFAQYDSLYRFLLKATHNDPDQRFQNADEMAEQLLGVLREVVATSESPQPAESTIFGADVLLDSNDSDQGIDSPHYSLLPQLKMDAQDEAASLLFSVSSFTSRSFFDRIIKQFPKSAEAKLRLASYLIDKGLFGEAEKQLTLLKTEDPFDWRVNWYGGRSLLIQNKTKEALSLFDSIYGELPGELAPKLAIALSAELSNEIQHATKFYDLVSRTNPNFISASFGLARCFRASGDRKNAVLAYNRVAPSSNLYTEAQMGLARVLSQAKPTLPTQEELVQAAQTLQLLTVDTYELHYLSAQVLIEAIKQLELKQLKANPTIQMLGQPLEPNSLRFGAEKALRLCARYAKTKEQRISLIDRANQIRPRTLI